MWPLEYPNRRYGSQMTGDHPTLNAYDARVRKEWCTVGLRQGDWALSLPTYVGIAAFIIIVFMPYRYV